MKKDEMVILIAFMARIGYPNVQTTKTQTLFYDSEWDSIIVRVNRNPKTNMVDILELVFNEKIKQAEKNSRYQLQCELKKLLNIEQP
jgi:hypothetical protein